MKYFAGFLTGCAFTFVVVPIGIIMFSLHDE